MSTLLDRRSFFATRDEDCPLCGRERWTLRSKTKAEPSYWRYCRRCDASVRGRRPGWLLETPLWSAVRPFMLVEDHATIDGEFYPRFRLEVEPPLAVYKRLTMILVQCVHCGNGVEPFRRRRYDQSLRMYYASSCPLNVRVGCSRSEAAHLDHRLVVEALGNAPKPSERQGRFDWS